MENGVQGFIDLDVWKTARQLRAEIYKTSKTFRKNETYALIYVTADVGEGYGRYSFQENLRFCLQSRASAYGFPSHG